MTGRLLGFCRPEGIPYVTPDTTYLIRFHSVIIVVRVTQVQAPFYEVVLEDGGDETKSTNKPASYATV